MRKGASMYVEQNTISNLSKKIYISEHPHLMSTITFVLACEYQLRFSTKEYQHREFRHK